ncbi:hypothetical protein KDW_54150 [Dictyobacter vulcani]|uniref:HTH luxR-type domain-containing protein n=1 Tax=Dictyobacter vulcani TaxID=2607529 RepID=A0A5J4KUG2_9CHLR|nr:LuxR C-terminal-related transcriptional regulator [Dictyobacter vulcani]GER91253.1 hypothetical protein KDW_54150 [Dictyobacter vulcani]
MTEQQRPGSSSEGATIAMVTPSEVTWKVPSYLTTLIGREKEVHDICNRIQQPDTRLLTLLGPGGVGKTRVALQVAQQLRGKFLHGIYFVSLSMVQDAHSVFSSIADTLELREQSERSLFEQVKIFLEQKACLLILDNFEHVLAAAPELEQLLLYCPGLRLLVTSRSVLHLLGEHQYPIAPLAFAEQVEQMTKEQLLHFPAISLFLRQAQAILPGFQLTPENSQAVAGICAHLDGLPLAIELAAARLKLIPLPTMYKELPQRLDLLTSKITSYPVRQQTLLNTLNWSYSLLTETEQYIFRLCSIFAQGSTLKAVEAIATGKLASSVSVMDTIATLIDSGLLYQVLDTEEIPRLRMLETMQAYGLARLQEHGELAASRQAHAEYYLSLAEEGESYLKGAQQISWLRLLEKEHGNFRLALQWLLDQQQSELLLRFCRALSRFWFLRGHWKESRGWMQSALELPTTQAQTVTRTQVLQRVGELAFYQNNVDSARSALEECLALCTSDQFIEERINALCGLSMLMRKQGESARASQLLDECEQLCRATSMIWELSQVLRTRGFTAWTRGDTTLAETCAHESLKLARQTGDQALIAKALSLLSAVAMQQNKLAQAIMMNQEILRIAELLEDTYLLATTVQNLGYLLANEEKFAEALALTQQGLGLFRDLGYKLLTANTLHTLGYIAMQQANYPLAFHSFQEGLILAHELHNDVVSGWHFIGLAELACIQTKYIQAAQFLGTAELRLDPALIMNTAERTRYDELVERVRQKLGMAQYARSWQEGQKMEMPQFLSMIEKGDLLSYRKEDTPPIVHFPETQASILPYQLTRRELEVIRLVAQGLTNTQIADLLVISARTVNWYLTNIYSKLQVTSRSAATRFVFEHGLLN